ncbi:ENTH/ANTH/VHS superfamily protein [Actinidia rufa]|uniref:ENTH/ANTH/VHS superfamily protein n=1 Tax=Actinidia rufa TaxID=165716 RepID=A0A7J0EUW7_9ERIC|nr:ENTH/ANTH/VHS superfamily protein [Actinidia rufa]
MAPSKLRKAIGAVKDQTSIGLAKVGSSASLSDLEVAIVKATRHDEYPAEEKHIREILSLTYYSGAYVGTCVTTISKRLSKTKNWVVALKTLMLIQRLLSDGDPTFEQEIFFATRRGTRLLNMSDFRDTSQSNSRDYSVFVRTYAMYLDEQLEFRMQGRRGKRSVFACDEDEEETDPSPVRATPTHDMRNERVFSRIQHLMYLLERFLACQPRGSTTHNRIVLIALYPVVKESFEIYYNITEILSIFIDRFMGLEVADSMKVHNIFSRVSKQFDELDELYGWCRHVGIGRTSEYPEVEKITQKKLDVMDSYIQDKSMAAHGRTAIPMTQTEEDDKKSHIVEEDRNAIKALPPPEGFPKEPEKEEKEEVKEQKKKDYAHKDTQKEADLLNLSEDMVTSEEHGDKLALALFDGNTLATGGPHESTMLAWEAFKDTENWETTLAQSASHLSNQKASLPSGFDMMLLDGMYKQGATAQAIASSGYTATGSASSVAFGLAGRPAVLALPEPPAVDGSSTSADPFAASLPVPPPSFVQMAEMEKKQRLLVEEQLLWQQYARDGMQGQVELTRIQPNPYPYNMGGYTNTC